MSNVLNIKPLSLLHTDEAATGGSFALDALERCGQPGESQSQLAIEHARMLVEDLEDCTAEEAHRLLSGYLDVLFQFSQGAKFVPDAGAL